MTDDLIAIIACCILGLMAHGARNQRWIEWVLRVTICLFLFGEVINLASLPEPSTSMATAPWGYSILVSCVVLTALLLFQPGRTLFSYFFTLLEQIIAGRFLLALFGKLTVPVYVPAHVAAAIEGSPAEVVETSIDTRAVSAESSQASSSSAPAESLSAKEENAEQSESAPSESAAASSPDLGVESQAASSADLTAESSSSAGKAGEAVDPDRSFAEASGTYVMEKVSFAKSFFAERIFVPSSIPHMNGLWIYITCLAFLLSHTEVAGFQMPSIMIPLPVSFDQLFSYNFLGLLLLAVCGVGIFVTRKPMEVLQRLGLVKPKLSHVLIGIAGIFVTFAYDYLWSLFTHSQSGLGYSEKLTHYNEGAFAPTSAPGSAMLLASATGICAGIGEEVLSRGALQPVLGILPAAFLHGVLHGQFAHAPMLILQVAGWSTIMGIIRKYTNTTTTIISHVGFNFLSTFLFAFNP